MPFPAVSISALSPSVKSTLPVSLWWRASSMDPALPGSTSGTQLWNSERKLWWISKQSFDGNCLMINLSCIASKPIHIFILYSSLQIPSYFIERQRGVLCEKGKDRKAEKISSNKHAKIIKQRCIRKERHSQKNK